MARPGTWPKGVSGNLNDRPRRGQSIAETLRLLLEVEADGTSRRQLILERVVSLALEGREWAVKFIAAYTDGLPYVRVEQPLSPPRPDYSRLTDGEIRTALALAEKATSEASVSPDGVAPAPAMPNMSEDFSAINDRR